MAALLVAMTVMAIGMLALLPAWRHQSQREKEAELAFRGEQYARAIYLFRTKNGNQPPPNIDVLVQGRYLRKKYLDPVTGEEFVPIFGGQQPQTGGAGQQGRGGLPQGRAGLPQGRGGFPQGLGGPSQGSGGIGTVTGSIGRGQQGRSGGPSPTGVGSGLSGGAQQGQGTGSVPGQGGTGLVTVQSKSKEASIRIYNNAAHYNEWQFLYNARGRGAQGQGNPGMPGSGVGRPGQRGGPGRGGMDTFPGGRGPMGTPGGRGTRIGGPGRGSS